MASLFQKDISREYMVQESGTTYKELQYGGNYVDSECSGFDDMFPTIDACEYPDYPWEGIEIPDHGEVCSQKWHYHIEADSLIMHVYGVRFPYKLEKRIRFTSPKSLHMQYKVTNLSGYDFDFIWAAHPMINMEEGGEIIVPYENGQRVMMIFASEEDMLQQADELSWVNEPAIAGSNQIDGRVTPGTSSAYKFYYEQSVPQGWCSYRYRSDGTGVTFNPKEKLPYLGIWVNEGGFKGHNNVALEMCTGIADRPDLAKKLGRNSVLPAEGTYEWFLNIDLT